MYENMKTVDVTPKWSDLLLVLLQGYTDGAPSGKTAALHELKRMAELADRYNEVAQRLVQDLPSTEQEQPEQPSKADLLYNRLNDKLNEQGTAYISTCDIAPQYGWSLDEYILMPEVVRRLKGEGHIVHQHVKFGVTDFTIIKHKVN